MQLRDAHGVTDRQSPPVSLERRSPAIITSPRRRITSKERLTERCRFIDVDLHSNVDDGTPLSAANQVGAGVRQIVPDRQEPIL